MEKLRKSVAVDRPGDGDVWRDTEEPHRRRLREDGRRPLAVNLAEGLALTEFLSRFTGSARSG
ncbi:MAG TPA: hypothetical protein VLL27_08980 [Solirubrobacterales bacterium]|nr:hypothetical protein [Solirubrobacterales bacterium]